jgi:nitronate monooxygenase
MTILPSMEAIPYDEYAKVLIENKVRIVETAGNNPKKWITLFKKAGLICIHKCTSIRHALSAIKYGADIISADIISMDGFECAGHPGEDDIGNFVL